MKKLLFISSLFLFACSKDRSLIAGQWTNDDSLSSIHNLSFDAYGNYQTISKSGFIKDGIFHAESGTILFDNSAASSFSCKNKHLVIVKFPELGYSQFSR